MVKKSFIKCLLLLLSIAFIRCADEEHNADSAFLHLDAIRIGTFNLNIENGDNIGAPIDQLIIIVFKEELDTASVHSSISVSDGSMILPFSYKFIDNASTMSISLNENLSTNKIYTLKISNEIKGKSGETFEGRSVSFKTTAGKIRVVAWSVGSIVIDGSRIKNIPLNPKIIIDFSEPILTSSISPSTVKLVGKNPGALSFEFTNNNTTLSVTSSNTLDHFNKYRIILTDQIKGADDESFDGRANDFYTELDLTPKFALLSDEDLLTLVQQQTFKYFWDYAHPVSGLARERYGPGNIVTSGGSGFGIMSIIVGIERSFITRLEGTDRLDKILDFLETADRFHGVWPHWMDGNTGNVVPFTINDNGGDLVETAFLMQGLLTFRQYLNSSSPSEQLLIDRINILWNEVEWDWYTQGGQTVLYWHWSPDKAWIMNHQIRGWNEALVIYVLAASSPGHTINASVYTNGWAKNGAINNGNNYYNINLPLGDSFGGPLFFAHYSFLGLDPRNLSDVYADYWTQNKNHTLINRQHCMVNPGNYVGYSDQNWGITASDNQNGYSAHSPTNDLGVITPTAALSSFPYTPLESMEALKFFYYTIGDKTWGQYGFYDAFNVTAGWYGSSYLAIDQGPIIIMIENYRTGLLWNLFMSSPEIQIGLTNLGFTY